jgi:hypothetical protein
MSTSVISFCAALDKAIAARGNDKVDGRWMCLKKLLWPCV